MKYGSANDDKEMDMHFLPCSKEFVQTGLDVSTVRRLHMFGLLPFVETLFTDLF